VSEPVLCARSKYCEDHLKQIKAEPKIISLANDNPAIFSLYVQLIYTGRIASKATIREDEHDPEFKRLCNLYVLALSLKDLTSQNLVIDALHAKSIEVAVYTYLMRSIGLPSREDIETMFLRTPGLWGAHRVLVDLDASKALGHWMRAEGKLFPHEFVSELAINMLDTRPISGKCPAKTVQSYYDKAVGENEGGETGDE
jgi:hypothetical protein